MKFNIYLTIPENIISVMHSFVRNHFRLLIFFLISYFKYRHDKVSLKVFLLV